MDVKKLDYFVHVAELGSFTKAAVQLSIAQSALSHSVRDGRIGTRGRSDHRQRFFVESCS